MTEPTRRCVVCRRPSSDRMACPACEQRMADQLHDVLEFYALAEGELVPGSSTGARGTEPSLGVRLSALDFLAGHDVVTLLASWEGEWREHYGLTVEPMIARPAPALSRCVAFLRAWLPRACADHPAIDDFAVELAECWLVARSAARCAPAREATVDCPTVGEDGEPCRGRLHVVEAERTLCPRCGVQRDLDTLLVITATDESAPVWVAPEDAARKARVSVRTLRAWGAAGRVSRRYGQYDLRSVLEHRDATRRQGA